MISYIRTTNPVKNEESIFRHEALYLFTAVIQKEEFITDNLIRGMYWEPKKLYSEVGPPQLMEMRVIEKLTR